MAGRSSAYWKKRFLEIEKASNAYGVEAFRQIEPAFETAQRQIQKEIESWYARYAKNNNISMTEARRQLSTKELKEFRWDVDEYIKYGRENALNAGWMKELENASARVHVNRLEALKIRTQHAAEIAFGNELDVIDEMARKVFTEDYYKSIFTINKGFGFGWEIGQIDQRKLETLITKPWAADGKNFSSRIWEQKSQLVNELHTQLTRTCVLGKAPDDAIKAISKKFNTTKNQAGRLVMTEQAYFHSVAQKEAFDELDVEEFEVVATLDSSTSDICQDMDGQHFPMKDYAPGVTAPPFHVWCRSVTVPWFEDNYTGERAARNDEGQTYYVPDDMTYKDWKNSFVNGNTKGLTPVDNINDLQSQLATKQAEIKALKQQIQEVQDKQFDYNRGFNLYNLKFGSMSEAEYKKYVDDLKVKEAEFDAKYKKYEADYTKYYSRPDRGTPERDEWDKWKLDNNIDIADITTDMFQAERQRDAIRVQIQQTERFDDWKTKFKGVTEQDFIDEVDKLTSKQNAIQKDIDDLNNKINDLMKKQNEAAFSSRTLQEIKDEIIKKHDSILKTDIEKAEFSDIIEGMDKERANLYDKLSDVFSQNHYYDKGCAWYSPWRKRVEMDLNAVDWERKTGKQTHAEWKVKFHEEMHQLDHMLGVKKSKFALVNGTTDSYVREFTQIRTASGKRMIKAIDDDIVDLINEAVDWDVKTNGVVVKPIKDLGRISRDAKDAIIRYLKHHYPSEKDRALIDTVTDAIGMTTSGKIHPYGKGFWGHRLSYCKDNGKDGATSEAWANLAAFMLRGDTEALDAVRKLMPRTVSTYQDIFDEVMEYAKSESISYTP